MKMMTFQKVSDMNIKAYDWHIVDTSVVSAELSEIAEKINQLVTKNIISNRIMKKYCEYRFYISENDIETDIETSFYQYFNDYVRTNTMNIVQVYRAYNTDYNPAENYDLTEESYNGIKKDKTTNTNTSNYGNSTNTSYKTTDNNSEKMTGKNVRENYSDSETSETNYNNNQSVNFRGSNTDNYNEITKNEIRKHGNIGVMSIPDMIKKENDIRFMNVVYKMIDTICDDLLIFVNTGD